MTEGRVTYKTLNEAIDKTRREIKSDVEGVRQEIIKLSERIDKTFVTQKEFCPVRDDVHELQDNQRWVTLTILGVVILAILALIIKPQLM
jgi:hypothetical protein